MRGSAPRATEYSTKLNALPLTGSIRLVGRTALAFWSVSYHANIVRSGKCRFLLLKQPKTLWHGRKASFATLHPILATTLREVGLWRSSERKTPRRTACSRHPIRAKFWLGSSWHLVCPTTSVSGGSQPPLVTEF